MGTRSAQAAILLTLLLVTVGGCKKKPKTVAPPIAPAPTIQVPATTTAGDKKPRPDLTSTSGKQPAVPPEVVKAKPKAKAKPLAKKPVIRQPAEPGNPAPEPTTVAKATPPRIVVQPAPPPAGDTPPTVVPDMSHTDEAHHRQTTEQLMQSTEANLKALKRVLNADERSLLQQVQLFMAQSREATQSQDLVRAHNLALKAHLLSDELVR